MFVTLLLDTTGAGLRAIESDSPSDRRSYVRALFALIEGLNYCQRRLAIEHLGFAVAARAKAREVARQETITARKAKLKGVPLATRASFAAFAAAHGVSNPLLPIGSGWEGFLKAVEVRNRITHPRTGADCEIGDGDYQVVRRAHQWYQDLSQRLLALPRGK